MSNSCNCREGKERVADTLGKTSRERKARRHADQREYCGGTWEEDSAVSWDLKREHVPNNITVNAVTLSGSRAEVRFTTLRGRSKNDGRRRGGKVETRETETVRKKEIKSSMIIMTYRHCSYFNTRTALITLWCRRSSVRLY